MEIVESRDLADYFKGVSEIDDLADLEFKERLNLYFFVVSLARRRPIHVETFDINAFAHLKSENLKIVV